MTEVTNLPVEEAQRRLAEQLTPRSEGASGLRGIDGNFEADTAELQRLEDEVQIGHGPPQSES
jgi:hypothetical protein